MTAPVWHLIGPDGQHFQAETPMRCVKLEIDSRIPAAVQWERLTASLADVVAWEAPPGWTMVPIIPSEAHIMSMAIRYDHAIGMPGYYDQPLFNKPDGVTHQQRLDSIKSQMRQLYDEAIGEGFFKLRDPNKPAHDEAES